MESFWNRKTFMIITGASQGIGKHFAIEFSRLLKSDSTVLLLARSTKNLEETKNLILSSNSKLNVQICSIDLSNPDAVEYRNILSPYSREQYELSFLVHNAGSVACHTEASKMIDPAFWNEYMSLNLYSVTVLTSVFLELFKNGERCLLNVSSLCAVKPFKGMGYYCIGKASREMYFKMLAEENPALNILNYSPGPVQTDMFQEIADKGCDEETRKSFIDMKEQNTAVKIEDTTQKVITALGNRLYKSGGTVDFYDRI